MVFTLCSEFYYLVHNKKLFIGIRASKDDEEYGLDLSELGSMGYPEFTKNNKFL